MDQASMDNSMSGMGGGSGKKSVGPIIGIVIIIVIIILGALFIYGGSVRNGTEPTNDQATAESNAKEIQSISAQGSSDEPDAILQDLKNVKPENLGAGLENL